MTAEFADRNRTLLGVACVGAFSDGAVVEACELVQRACATLARTAAPVVLVAGVRAAREPVVDAVGTADGLWVRYEDEGARHFCGHGVVAGSWRERDPDAADAADAACRAMARSGRRRAMALVLCGDLADEADRARALALAQTQWRAGCVARVEYLDDPPGVVWLDTETTCAAPNLAGIIELGAVACDSSSQRMRGQLELRLKIEPWAHVDPQALLVNKYDPRRWAIEGVDHDDGLLMLAAWLPRRFRLAAYNIGFDRSAIRHSFERINLPEPGWGDSLRHVDPLPLVRQHLKRTGKSRSAKLTAAAEFFGIATDSAHTALFDAHLARLVYLALMNEDIAPHVAEVGL